MKFGIKDRIKNNFGHIESHKAKLLEELESLDIKEESHRLSDEDIAKRLNLKGLFKRKVQEEEIKWKRFYHSMATTRMRGNKFNYLTVNGNRLEDREGITRHIINFYLNLYSKDERSKPSLENLQFSSISNENAN